MYVVHKEVFVCLPHWIKSSRERAHFSIRRSSFHHPCIPRTHSYPWSHMIRHGPHCSVSLKAQGHFMDSQCDQFVAAPPLCLFTGFFSSSSSSSHSPDQNRYSVPTLGWISPEAFFPLLPSMFPLRAPRGCLETGTSPTMDSNTFISA